MAKLISGLTATYNLFHDETCDESGILRLRELHDDLDRAVLKAYGWSDIRSDCRFIPNSRRRRKSRNGRQPRKKYRYRWPDEIRDEVLARLLDLNRQRALEEGVFYNQHSSVISFPLLQYVKQPKPEVVLGICY